MCWKWPSLSYEKHVEGVTCSDECPGPGQDDGPPGSVK